MKLVNSTATKHLLAIVVILIALLPACKKEAAVVEGWKPPYIWPSDTCQCTALPDKEGNTEYIKAKINGVPVCFDLPINYGADTIFNTFRYGNVVSDTGKLYYDHVLLQNMDSRNEWTIRLGFENTHLLTKTFPYQLPRENPEVCEIAEIQVYWMGMRWIGEADYTHYNASFFHVFGTVTVNGFSGNVIEGSFWANPKNKIGQELKITEGKFRIRLNVLNRDIVIK